MSLSFEDSLKNSMVKMATPASIEPKVAVANMDVNVNNMEVEDYSIMTLDESNGIAAYAGDDGNWNEHTKYDHYSVFSDDNISTISDTKDISLNRKQLSITQEINSQYIPFEMPRYYDGFDLKDTDIWIHYVTSGKNHGATRAINVRYNNEKIRFGWLIEGGSTIDAGALKFEIHATGSFLNKNKEPIAYVWKSKSDANLIVLQSICPDDEIVNEINDSWIEKVVTRAAEEIAEKIAGVEIGGQVEAAQKAAEEAMQSSAEAQQYAKNASTAATNAVNAIIANYPTKDDINKSLEDYIKTSDVNAKLGNLVNSEGQSLTVEDYIKQEVDAVDVSEQIGELGTDKDGNPITNVVDYVDMKVGDVDVSEQLKSYYTKSETYSKGEVDGLLDNVDLTGYATEKFVTDKTDVLKTSVDANASNITAINSTIARINQDLESIDKTPNAYYVTTYNKPYTLEGVEYTGENTLVLWKTDETDSDVSVRTYVSSHEITGGSGGATSSNTIVIERVTSSPIVVSSNDKIVIDYIFTGTDSSGEDINIGYATWKIGDKTVVNKELIKTSVNMENGFNTKDLTEYIGIGSDQKVTLLITDDVGSPPQSKTWYVSVVDVKLESKFIDTNYNPANSSVDFTFIPHGAVDKMVYFSLDGNPIGTKESLKPAAGLQDFYTIPAQEHGSHLLEVYMTAQVGSDTVTSNKIIKDILWYDSSSDIPVIGINYHAFDNFSVEENTFTAKQYNGTKIEYTVYDPSTNFPTVTIEVDGETVSTRTLDKPTDSHTFNTNVVGKHVIKIICGETVKTINANIEKLDIDVSPITTGLVFDFNPSGYSNNSDNRLWSNGLVNMTVTPNFDWTNGGYKTETKKAEDGKEYEESYFLIKAGTKATFDYKMFDGGINKNPSVTGSEMKLVFMTEKVQNKDAVWFSNVESTTTEVDGVSQITNVGIQLGVHEGWLKTNNASDIDVVGEDSSSSIASTNTYLYLPYSEEDIIEMDINISAINGGDKAFVMAYEDGVPSKAYVYDDSDRFYQYDAKPIVIGSDYCDVRIYRMKVYSNSLETEDIMKNFIADARSTDDMIKRYNKNSIYYNSSTGNYTPYRREGILDPERLALAVPNVKILMLETDHFTTSKKTFVKSSFRCIHAPGGDIFEGDEFYDNWLFENGWHSGQGTTSDNYGNSSRNVDFLFNCDGIHKPSDKVEAESNYISQVTLGYGTENAITEKVTDWKGDSGKISLTRTSVPNNFFNMKVNVASSENVNNMLLQKRYNDFLPYISPAKKRDSNIKCTMEFVPAILFIRETNPDISTHTEFLDTNWHFYSLGNIGDSKKTDYTRAYDPEDMNEFTIEISDNTKNNATFQSGVYLDNNGNRQIEKFTIIESEEDGEIILTPVSTDKPQSFVYPITMEEWENENNMRHWCIYNEGFDGDHSFEARYACCGDYRDGKLVNDTSGRGKEQMKLNEGVWRAFYRWVITSTDEEFVNELDEWCVRSAVEFFYAFTHMYTMMDNRAKNTFWHFAKTGTYRKVSKPVPELLHIYCEFIDGEYVTTSDVAVDSSKTYYTQYAFDMHDYDNDTALGINNNGELIFPYGKEDVDYNIDGDPASGYVFNGATSVFWCRLRDLLASEIKTTFQTVASECFSASDLIKQFDNYQECFPEEIWRLDIERKYIRIFNGESVDNSKPKYDDKYLRDMMQGRKKYQRRQWIRDQELYFGTMNIIDTVVGDDNRITFRCYTPDSDSVVVKPDYTLRITPYSDMYVSVMFGNGGVQQKRAKAGVEYTIECPLSTMTDTQVVIYGANRIQALNDLSACYIDENNFSNATRLKKLVLGNTTEGYNNPKFTSLSIGNNKLLEELDIRNCRSLTGSLNLTNCNNLLKLYAEGTKLTGVTFATNGKIQLAHLPNTVNTLIMRNLNSLTDFEATLSQLETLTLQGGTLDSLDIVTRCINTLRVLYLYDIDWELNRVELLNEISLLFYSILTGTVTVPTIGQYDLLRYQEAWSDLTIIPKDGVIPQYKVIFRNDDGFVNDDGSIGTILDTQYIDQYGNAIDPTNESYENYIGVPTKESTIQNSYTFIGWDKAFTNVIDDMNVYATYEESLREYEIQYVSMGTPVYTSTGIYGSNVEYVGDMPTYTSAEPTVFYLFDRWDKSGFLLEGENGTDLDTGVKTVTAIFDTFRYTSGAFAGRNLDDLKPVEIYALSRLIKVHNKGTSFENYGIDVSVGDKYSFEMGYDIEYNDIVSTPIIVDGIYVKEDDNKGSNAIFSGSNHIDTGIKLFDEDKDFVLAVDYKISSSNTSDGVFMQCFQTSGSNGFKFEYTGGSSKLTWGNSSSISPSPVDSREMIVIRHIKGDNKLYVYASNLDSNNYTVFDPMNKDGSTTTIYDTTLVFGMQKTDGNVFRNGCIGNINWCKIWYKDLGEDICKKLVEWTHEKINLSVSGFGRYASYDDPTKEAMLSLVADNLLDKTKHWHTSNAIPVDWASSSLNTFLNSRFYNAIPSKIKSLMMKMDVYSTAGGKSTSTTNSGCYVTLPSLYDLDISKADDRNNTGYYKAEVYDSNKPITIMQTPGDRARAFSDGSYYDYWTRSPNPASTSSNQYVWFVADGKSDNGTTLGNFYGIRTLNTEMGVLIEISF